MATAGKNLSSYDVNKVPDGASVRIGIVLSEWNKEITDKLYSGAVETLEKHGVHEKRIFTHHVPGAFELSLGA
jgi:6,7-dimethyl-8-ribityllumazine synthase